MEAEGPSASSTRVERLRGWILVILVLGLAGTVTELVLLSHYEQPLQLVPVVLIALAMLTLVWHAIRGSSHSLSAILIVMILFVAAGFAGFLAHFQGAAEFQLDLDSSISTWNLLMKVLHAKAPPLLAPGMMIQLGLLGLSYVLSDSSYRARMLSGSGVLAKE